MLSQFFCHLRCRLLQRPATVPGARGTAGEARSANEMRILGMNQPFPAIFGGEDVRRHSLGHF